ncbi:TcfC E-set like domain-containing protein [Vibrio chagasii]|uniref:TcfC E-set like domain-containing protein n=1 Tax=Vibrio chagasii TaxID=170679 RepID=UPI003DA03B79
MFFNISESTEVKWHCKIMPPVSPTYRIAIICILTTFFSGEIFASNEELTLAGDYQIKVPKGFELVNESQVKSPVVVYFLGEPLDSGYLIVNNDNSKTFESMSLSQLELDVGESISCKGINDIKNSLIYDLCAYSRNSEGGELKLVQQYEISRGKYLVLLADDWILENYLKEKNNPILDEKYRLSNYTTNNQYLTSNATSISGRIGYRAIASHDDQDNVVSSVSFPSIFSYKNTQLLFQPTLQKDKYNSKFALDQLNTSNVSDNFKYEFGFKSNSNNNVTNLGLGLLDNVGVIGGWFSNTDSALKIKSNNNFGYGEPLVVYMPFQGTIEVFMKDRLIYTKQTSAGRQVISLEELPLGNYDVRIDRKSVDGIKIEPLFDTVNKSSQLGENFSLAIGLGSKEYSSSNVFGKDFSSTEPYFGVNYSKRLSKKLDGIVTANVLGGETSLLSNIKYAVTPRFGLGLTVEFDPKNLDWATQTRTNFTLPNIAGNDLSSSVYFRNIKKNDRYSASLLANTLMSVRNVDWLNTVGLNGVYNIYGNSNGNIKNNDSYKELNFVSSSHLNIFNLPLNLSFSIGTSSSDDLRGNLSLSLALASKANKQKQTYYFNGGYSYSNENANTVDVSGRVKGDGYDYSAIGQVGKDTKTFGLNGSVDNSAFKSSFGLYRSNRKGEAGWSGNESLNLSGNVYFSGSEFLFDSEQYDAGILLETNNSEKEDYDSELYASSQNEKTVKLNGIGKTLIPVRPFSEGNVLINGTNSFASNDTLSYSFFPGNFAYENIDIMKRVGITGYIKNNALNSTGEDGEQYFVDNGSEIRRMYQGSKGENVLYFDSMLILGSENIISNNIQVVDKDMKKVCQLEIDDINVTKKAIKEGYMYVGQTTCQ